MMAILFTEYLIPILIYISLIIRNIEHFSCAFSHLYIFFGEMPI